MTRTTLILTLLGLTFAAAVASAGTFTVTLTNGSTFETRYRPTEAEWDDSVVLFTTDRGNWIALSKEEIADVTSSVEETGFGYQVDTTTLFVGWSPNEELPEEGEEGAEGQQQFFEPPPQSFTLDQFVNPGQTAGFGGSINDPVDVGF
jgi:hypothetical protein